MNSKRKTILKLVVIPCCIIGIMIATSGQAFGARQGDIGLSNTYNADLKRVTISNGTLSPSFSFNVTNYSAKLDNTLIGKTISLRAEAIDLTSKIKVTSNGVEVGSSGKGGYCDANVKLELKNYVIITVTSGDGVITQSYQISITVGQNADLKSIALGQNTDLSRLTLPKGMLSPSFSSDIINYSVKLDSSFIGRTISLRAETADPYSKMIVTSNGKQVGRSDLVGSSDISLKLETQNDVVITVTTWDGKITQRYQISITVGKNAVLKSLTLSNGTLSPSFSPDVTNYTVLLDSVLNTGIISLRAMTVDSDSDIRVTLNGINVENIGLYGCYDIRLNTGGQNYVAIIVNAGSGKATQIYQLSITIVENADLKGLTLSNGTLSPSFSAEVTNYSVKIDSALAMGTIPLRATAANPYSKITITSNSIQVGRSGVNGYCEIILKLEAQNDVVITVTSGDGKAIQTYHLSIIVGPNVDLNSLELSDGTLSPSFSPDITSYNISLDSSMDKKAFYLRFSTADSQSRTKVDSNVKITQRFIRDICLISFDLTTSTQVKITVTSKDGTTSKTYNVNIKVGQNADLKSLTLSNGALNPSFSADKTLYNVKLDSSFDEKYIYMIPLKADSKSEINVESSTGISQTPGGDAYIIPVSATKVTEVDISVTSNNSEISKIYRLIFTVASACDATLSSITADHGTVEVSGIETMEVNINDDGNTVKLTLLPSDPKATIRTIIENSETGIGSEVSVIFTYGKYSRSVLAEVTAADGSTKKTYSITINRLAIDEVTLKSLQVDGKDVDGFNGKNINSYTIELPYGTKVVPSVSAVVLNPKANVIITPATSIPGTTSIIVLAHNGANIKYYSVIFTLAAKPNPPEIVPVVTVTPVPVTGASLNQAIATLEVGDGADISSIQLTATLTPDKATNQEVTWTSSNSQVAAVDQTGLVTAVGAGNTTITVTSLSNLEVSATAEVNVIDVTPVSVTEITLNHATALLEVGNGAEISYIQLTTTVAPDNATNQEITWTSSNSQVASVDQTGLVTAVGAGNTSVTAASASNPEVSVTAEVTVIDVTQLPPTN